MRAPARASGEGQAKPGAEGRAKAGEAPRRGAWVCPVRSNGEERYRDRTEVGTAGGGEPLTARRQRREASSASRATARAMPGKMKVWRGKTAYQ
jgi:hypothetical protein